MSMSLSNVPSARAQLSPELELIDLRAVMRMTSLSKRVIYRLMKTNDFPPSVPISPRRVAWERSSVQAWVRERVYGDPVFRAYLGKCKRESDH